MGIWVWHIVQGQPTSLPEETVISESGVAHTQLEKYPFFRGALEQLASVLRGGSLVVLAIVIAVILLVEGVAAGLILSQQHPTAEKYGYAYGKNVGAEVVRTKLPYSLNDLYVSPDGRLQGETDSDLVTFDPETLRELSVGPLPASPLDNVDYDQYDFFWYSTSADSSSIYVGGQVTNDAATDKRDSLFLLDASSGAVIREVVVGGVAVGSSAVSFADGTVFVQVLNGDAPDQLVAYTADLKVERARMDAPADSDGFIDAVSEDGKYVCFDDLILEFDGVSFSVKSDNGYGCASFIAEGQAVVRAGFNQFVVTEVQSGKNLFRIPTATYFDPPPVALADPSLGFVVYGDGYESSYDPYLYRYESSAPKITLATILGAIGLIDLGLILLAVLGIFVVPFIRHRRSTAPERAALANERLRQLKIRQEDQVRAAADEAQRADHATRVEAIAKWEAAYSELHPGEPIPTMPAHFAPVGAVAGQQASNRTNTLAILALVFGLGGGLLGIIFGHAAHSQIRKSGERGWGLATAGLFFGYLGLIVSIVIIVVVAVAASRQ